MAADANELKTARKKCAAGSRRGGFELWPARLDSGRLLLVIYCPRCCRWAWASQSPGVESWRAAHIRHCPARLADGAKLAG